MTIQLPATYRPWFAKGAAVVAFAMPLIWALLVLSITRSKSEGIVGALLAWVMLSAIFTTAAYVAGRPKLNVDEDGLTVRNYFGGRQIKWADVATFSLPAGAIWARAELRSGAEIVLHALQPAQIAWILRRRSKIHPVVDDLNSLLTIKTGQAPGAPRLVMPPSASKVTLLLLAGILPSDILILWRVGPVPAAIVFATSLVGIPLIIYLDRQQRSRAKGS